MKDDPQENFQKDNFSLPRSIYKRRRILTADCMRRLCAHRLFQKKVYFLRDVLVYSGNDLSLSRKKKKWILTPGRAPLALKLL